MNLTKTVGIFSLIGLLLLLWGVLFTPGHTYAQATFNPPTTTAAPPLCRFGLNSAYTPVPIDQLDILPLRAGWYIDYFAKPDAPRPAGMEYAPMIRLAQTAGMTYTYSPDNVSLSAAIAAHPGADWQIGNEPDRIYHQDDMHPTLYARAYHDLYHLIKLADPTARIFAGSIVQPTVLRMQYVDLVLESYQQQFGEPMPVDGWAIHNFILNEVSCASVGGDGNRCWGAEIPRGVNADSGLVVTVNDNDNFTLFSEQIVRFRQWMATHGYTNKPLYVSEYGVLMPDYFGFPPDRVNRFMTKSFDYLLNTRDSKIGFPVDDYRLVQRLSWYSLTHKGYNGYLFDRPNGNAPFQLSLMGRNYLSYTQALTGTVDFLPVSLQLVPDTVQANFPTTITLKAELANSGNLLFTNTVSVRFFVGDPAQGGEPIGNAQQIRLTGCGERETLETQWANATLTRTQPIYIQVDPLNTIDEINEANNSTSITLTTTTLPSPTPTITPTPLPPLEECEIAINNGAAFTNQRNVIVRSKLNNASEMQISQFTNFADAAWQAYQPTALWTLPYTETELYPITLYARFQVTSSQPLCLGNVISDSILYDSIPPTLTATLRPANSIELTAVDQPEGSGVSEMQLSSRSDFGDTIWVPFADTVDLSQTSFHILYLRVRDGAGNVSQPAVLRFAPDWLYLPLTKR